MVLKIESCQQATQTSCTSKDIKDTFQYNAIQNLTIFILIFVSIIIGHLLLFFLEITSKVVIISLLLQYNSIL